MSLEGPARSLIWTQINFSEETWKQLSTDIPSKTDRAEFAEKNNGISPNPEAQSLRHYA